MMMAMTVECRYCTWPLLINAVGEVQPTSTKCEYPGQLHHVHPGDKPVKPIELTQFIIDGADNGGIHCGNGDVGEPNLGVIVYYYGDRRPKICYTRTVEYRDQTLVPFFTHYHAVRMIGTF